MERRTRQQHGLAGFLVQLGDAQVDLNLLVQHREFLVAVRGSKHTALGRCHRAHRAVAVNDHQVRFRLIQILGNGGFDHQIGAVGQALHTDVARVVAENFRQTVLVGGAGGLPAVALAVFVVARCGQRFVVGGNFGGVDLVSFGNRLSLAGEIPLGVIVVGKIAFDLGNGNRELRLARLYAGGTGRHDLVDCVFRQDAFLAGSFQLLRLG